ncbi:MAG: hypothetical protein L3J96_03255 [Thermoplasmata archaeon]|nr:hypothetical protein [Thermoplasmata archaeon]
MTSADAMPGDRSAGDILRQAESALKRFGYSRIPPVSREAAGEPEFWVQESGVPRRTFPVFVEASSQSPRSPRWAEWVRSAQGARSVARRAIVVVPTDHAAKEAWDQIRRSASSSLDPDLSILVLPGRAEASATPHWHQVVVEPRELLRLATGVVVGLFRRLQATEGASQIDFEEMLGLLRDRFRVDVHRSLNVTTDEDALFLLYQLAVRDSYAPGDTGSNLHLLVLRPTGPAARLPWFGA